MMILIILSGGLALFSLWMLWRNNKVFNESMRILNIISNLSQQDIACGLDYRWRYDDFNTISYNKMMLEFWKPVESFFAHELCCQESNIIKKGA